MLLKIITLSRRQTNPNPIENYSSYLSVLTLLSWLDNITENNFQLISITNILKVL